MQNNKILIVENNLDEALLMTSILENEGAYQTFTVSTVDEAILSIEQNLPRLVLIAFNLGQEKNGVELGLYLLKKDQIPYIFVLDCYEKSTLDLIIATRPFGFISKPYSAVELLTKVSILINNFNNKNIEIGTLDDFAIDDVPYILKESIKFIEENINEKIIVSELAKKTRWESQHYNRLFTKYIGTTPHKYIVEKKIEKAKNILTQTAIPITQVSFELGFKSHSNFCSIFKKITSKTPENFRKWNE